MGELKGRKELFAGRHFDREIIVLCVRWYLRYKLSLRDLVEMMAERGLDIAHTTIMRWYRDMFRSSRSAGMAMHARAVARGVLTRRI
jgi:transposase-like protein